MKGPKDGKEEEETDERRDEEKEEHLGTCLVVYLQLYHNKPVSVVTRELSVCPLFLSLSVCVRCLFVDFHKRPVLPYLVKTRTTRVAKQDSSSFLEHCSLLEASERENFLQEKSFPQ